MEAAPATMARRGQSHAPNPRGDSRSAGFQAHGHELPDRLFTYIPLSTEAPFLGLRSRLRSVRYPRKLGECAQRQ